MRDWGLPCGISVGVMVVLAMGIDLRAIVFGVAFSVLAGNAAYLLLWRPRP